MTEASSTEKLEEIDVLNLGVEPETKKVDLTEGEVAMLTPRSGFEEAKDSDGTEEPATKSCGDHFWDHFPDAFGIFCNILVPIVCLLLLFPYVFLISQKLYISSQNPVVAIGYEAVSEMPFPSVEICMVSLGKPLWVLGESDYCEYYPGVYAEGVVCDSRLTCDFEEGDTEDEDELYCCEFDNSKDSLMAKNGTFSVNFYFETDMDLFTDSEDYAPAAAEVILKDPKSKADFGEDSSGLAAVGKMTVMTLVTSRNVSGNAGLKLFDTLEVIKSTENYTDTYSAAASYGKFYGQDVDEGTMALGLQFGDFTVMTVRSAEAYTWTQWLGDFGGVAGLITGWALYDFFMIAHGIFGPIVVRSILFLVSLCSKK
jgi:hypothetical protein